MQILLSAATLFEIKPAVGFLASQNYDVDVLITGIGMTATTYSLMKSISIKKYDLILQAGIAGCLDKKINHGQVVVVKNDTIGDMGVVEKDEFKPFFEMGLGDQNSFPWKNGKLSNNNAILKECGLTAVEGVTVNEISTNKERISFYRDTLHAEVESMEGAALHYVGQMEHIPFLQIRSVSNFVGERDKSKWFMKGAVEALNEELQKIFSKLLS